MVKPTTVSVDAPVGQSATLVSDIRAAVEEHLLARGVSLLRLERSDILAAFGVSRVVDRRELRQLMDILWPDMERIRGKVRPYVADAAAGALYADFQVQMGDPPA